ncbi:MAG: hypothetical protein SH818_18155 [Saprospiraceae bacterium]|nr:hypothetical protein [Saprospiraceae bacterium]
MKYSLTLSIFLIFQISLLSQDPAQLAISNTQIKVSEHQDKVTITYDLARTKKIPFYNIFLRITIDGEEIQAKGLSGDIGNTVYPGTERKVIWDALTDVSELSGELKIEVLTNTQVSASEINAPSEVKIVPAYAGLGGVVVTGGTLAFLGFKAFGDYKPLYSVYKLNTNPSSSIFNQLSREEYYDDANSKYKKGQYMLIAGVTILAAGGYMMISRIIKIKKYKKKMSAKQPNSAFKSFEVKPSFAAYSMSLQPGLSLKISF